ncbi:LysE family translocator [Collimonas pratensis]|uniref:LysE type translocator family protein n=1 Tax=Collimonas pratensis TaxID=279113 RepID=A0ABM5Z3C4_9BURK|nr:LysE family transporter [Collimonas pratensis]AMP13650.1 lysE type translocator family protein [Collimonas pratensis]
MFSTLITVFFLHLAAMMTPGANVLLISQLAASDRSRSAGFAALGVTVGAGIWASCAVLGINAIFQAFPWLRLALQITGGLYLLYVASRLWRSGGVALNGNAPHVSSVAAFRLGFLTNITNPKSALFFGSVFAASFPATPGPLLQVAAVAMIVMNALLWHSLLAYFFSRRRIRAAYSRASRISNRIAAVAVGALGLSLLVVSLREARS